MSDSDRNNNKGGNFRISGHKSYAKCNACTADKPIGAGYCNICGEQFQTPAGPKPIQERKTNMGLQNFFAENPRNTA